MKNLPTLFEKSSNFVVRNILTKFFLEVYKEQVFIKTSYMKCYPHCKRSKNCFFEKVKSLVRKNQENMFCYPI